MLAMGIEARLKEIQDVLNNDLIPWLYKMNGWRDTEMPKFVYGDLDETDLEVFSKAIQRIKAVGLIAPTPGILIILLKCWVCQTKWTRKWIRKN